jgi:hypothetical protein
MIIRVLPSSHNLVDGSYSLALLTNGELIFVEERKEALGLKISGENC